MAELTMRGLTVRIGGRTLVEGMELDLAAGSLVALVGGSGSGKTLTTRALVGLVDASPGVVSAELMVRADGVEHHPYRGASSGLSRAQRDRAFAAVRGAIVGYLPQDAGGALVPFDGVGRQLTRVARLGGRPEDPVPWLVAGGFDPGDARRVVRAWPHQLSGGMAQRVGLAIALARGSRLLLADEPTTGLDAPLQSTILRSLRASCDRGLGVLLVTHDLRSLPELADRIVVMDQGRAVETLTPDAVRAGEASAPAARRLLDALYGVRP
ncbi:MAG: ATP-binding cassette domain-containing protein [Myxococcota bacterium]